MKHEGGCHCGAVRFAFESDKPLAPRACQCGFCRKHNARTVADPDGSAVLAFAATPIRYRFGLGVTDFLICGRCGCCIGAETEIGGCRYATLNLNAFDEPRLDLEAEPISYDGESPTMRAARRHERWTPRVD